MAQVVRANCRRVCGSMCGILLTIIDGKVIKVEGDPESPFNKGYICPKGRALPELLHHPNRLTQPLKRIGEKGKDKWEKITKDEAVQTVALRLKECAQQHGPESIMFFVGAAKWGNERGFVSRLASSIGTPNIASIDNVCHGPRGMGEVYTYGRRAYPDFSNPPRCIVIWGRNSLQTGGEGSASDFQPILRGNTKIIVIDPRKIPLASRADLWIRPKPGSDGLLALGVLNIVVEEKLYDRSFVEKWVIGFDEFREFISNYPPTRVEESTWVPRDQIEAVARMYSTSRPAAIQWGNAVDQTSNALQTCRAISILRALTGNVDVPGGDIFPVPVPTENISRSPLNTPHKREAIGSKYKLSAMSTIVPCQLASKAILHEDPYPIKAALIFGSNPILTHANSRMVYEAFKKLDFQVVADLFMTPTVSMADIVLPVAANLEYDDLCAIGNYIAAIPKMLDPPGECRSDLQWINELAAAMGFGEHFWPDERHAMDAILKPAGLDYEELKKRRITWSQGEYRKYERQGFRTPSGKVELYSNRLKEMGFDPLPMYHEKETPAGSWEKSGEYPLIMTSYKNYYFYHSSHRNIPSLRKLSPEPVARLHPETMKKLGLNQGGMVNIETQNGRIKQRLRSDPDIDHRVVLVAYGWWFPEDDDFGWEEANINILTSNDPPFDPAIGTPNLRGLMCKITRA
ncbi:MAG: molybdopterin-dependent oxidoreductase [Candidatus Bathyarchaeota archaeon]|nr:molybdopterin-dependent oxidoreductase [Candidatus Bathyarchaeota archaeon]